MNAVIVQAFNALSVSSILLLIALGLVFSFGLMNVINMAHGEFIMVGAYMTYVVQRVFFAVFPAASGIYIFFALAVAFLVSGLLGLVLERLLIRHLYGRPLDTLLATWGVGLVLQQTARAIFGAPNVDVIAPSWLNGGVALAAGVLLSYKRLFILALVVVCIVAIYLYVTRSAPGRRMRAVMQNREMASCLGLSTARVDALTFALGSGLAGIAGCALTLLGSIGPTLGTNYIVDAFMVVVLGGVGQIGGTILAALAIGGFGTVFEFGSTASIGKVLVFVMIIAFLQWKPNGLVALRARS
ncbi:MAG: urea transport system permease protein [Chloroflexota bacterium]|jgi:urea transport system permease protein|nr:urea transport system permease protein [Chloroflexota bacterium]